MPASDLILYAKWDVIKTAYIVEHYKENVETGAYDLAERSYRYADTDTIVEPAVNQYDGYTNRMYNRAQYREIRITGL